MNTTSLSARERPAIGFNNFAALSLNMASARRATRSVAKGESCQELPSNLFLLCESFGPLLIPVWEEVSANLLVLPAGNPSTCHLRTAYKDTIRSEDLTGS